MNAIVTEIIFLAFLILLNGLFAMSEIAIISARRARLQTMMRQGNRGARIAIDLADSPNRFLSTVQVGITLVGIFAGAFGGATIAQQLSPVLAQLPVIGPSSSAISLALVVAVITYLTVLIGELVPKRLGLQNAERVAALTAEPMQWLSRLATPVVRLLSISTDAVLRLLRVPLQAESTLTEEEIKVMVAEGAEAGIIEEAERDMVTSVFRFADQRMESLMTPRTDIVWLDVNAPEAEVRQMVEQSAFTRFPVCDGELDKVIGVVKAKDLLARSWADEPFDLRATMHEPLFLPETMLALRALERFKETGMHLGLLVDEFGGIEGLVTLINILEAIVGDIPTPEEMEAPPLVQREDGSWLVDGLFLIEEFKEVIGVESFPNRGSYQTLGGFMILMIGHLPKAGEYFSWSGFRFEVVDMDGKRVDKVLVMRLPEAGIVPEG